MTKQLYDYLKDQWKRRNLKKYQKYFDEWINGLTDDQIQSFKIYWLK